MGYDLFDPAVHDDPDPWFARLRAECPVHHDPERNFFTVADTTAILGILRDPRTWSSRFRNGLTFVESPDGPMLLDADPPTHTWQRRLLQKSWTPRYIARLEERARAVVAERFDALGDATSGDFTAEVAGQVPVAMIAELVGVPAADRARFAAWSQAKVQVTAGTPGALEAAAQADRELVAYFTEFLAERRRALDAGEDVPEDYTTMILRSEHDGARLDEVQTRRVLGLLVLGGIETTVLLLGNLMHRVITETGLADRLRDDPARCEQAVEETLRIDSPTLGLFRTPITDRSVCGTTIPADTKTMVLFAAVNRDPALWDEPDRFDLDRDPVRLRQHVAFGHGVHLCLGAPLARLEGRVVLEAIVRRMPGVRYLEPPRRNPTMIFRGFDRQLVAWG